MDGSRGWIMHADVTVLLSWSVSVSHGGQRNGRRGVEGRRGRGRKAVERRGAKRVVEEGGVLIYIMERIRAQGMAIKVGRWDLVFGDLGRIWTGRVIRVGRHPDTHL